MTQHPGGPQSQLKCTRLYFEDSVDPQWVLLGVRCIRSRRMDRCIILSNTLSQGLIILKFPVDIDVKRRSFDKDQSSPLVAAFHRTFSASAVHSMSNRALPQTLHILVFLSSISRRPAFAKQIVAWKLNSVDPHQGTPIVSKGAAPQPLQI